MTTVLGHVVGFRVAPTRWLLWVIRRLPQAIAILCALGLSTAALVSEARDDGKQTSPGRPRAAEKQPRVETENVKQVRLAAQQGDTDAQVELAVMYHSGEGVPKDYAEAARWFRKAADQGVAQAQSNLGFMYQNGEGVSRDSSQAVEWWRKAAEQGHTGSQYNLGVAYHYGEGVEGNDVEAYKWVDIAWTRSSGTSQKKYGVLREVLAKKMTDSQLAEAKDRVRQWVEAFDSKKQ